ncbi:MAG TPA: M15 family metallopeptidase, partial [Acidimicrobiia bacterium]|nr:M15 family metallopeptidase [Acidimicrobiia bacterium]
HGGVFAFGDARFHGSVPGLRQAGHRIGPARIVALVPVPTDDGYWVLDDRGGVFTFGGAPFLGSLPQRGVAGEAVGMGATPDGSGYWIATSDGGVHAFGTARFRGDATGAAAGVRAVGFSAPPDGTGYWILLENGAVVARPAPPFRSSVAAVTAGDLGASWRAGCPVPPEHLRSLTVSHWGFDGAVRTGELVVHADHVERIRAVMQRLYDVGFPIERMVPVDAYGGSDDASMDANNTSAFNCRTVAGTSRWSQHAYGLAIDVNPVQNPYVRGSTVSPDAGRTHLERSRPAPGKILAGGPVVQAFAAHGWHWGGNWSSSKDYQHFSSTGS